MFYICLLFIILFFLIRKFILLKIIKKYQNKILEIGFFFNKEFKNNYIEYYYNSSLIYIYIHNLNIINKYLIFFNLSKIEKKLNNDIIKIINIYLEKQYDIDYFIQDLKITKTKPFLFKELKLKIILKLFVGHLKSELYNIEKEISMK